ncbi:hypothetical protein [Brevibacillus dissolubilis]|uniref:hypothetical protein n=1 Tax=Brevibacillus dissolubilis TaxID=1844116 RepID=UPI001115BBDB|nr:hypothetical protein [Brevibacillus dissolubilis]
MALQTNCETCCQPGDILCVNIPGGIRITLLGLNVEICPLCIRIFTEDGTITPEQMAQAEQVMTAVRALLGTLVPTPTTPTP